VMNVNTNRDECSVTRLRLHHCATESRTTSTHTRERTIKQENRRTSQSENQRASPPVFQFNRSLPQSHNGEKQRGRPSHEGPQTRKRNEKGENDNHRDREGSLLNSMKCCRAIGREASPFPLRQVDVASRATSEWYCCRYRQ
jgi:hypothetical protein